MAFGRRAVLALGALAVALPRAAFAEQAATVDLAALLARLDRHAASLEQMKKKTSYTVRGRLDELDGDGKVAHAKEMTARITATGGVPLLDVQRYLEDGVDKTTEAQEKAKERRKKPPKKKRDFHLPFLASEQPRYTFTLLERDPNDANRVRIGFAPREPAEDAYKGSAWVDAQRGEVLTMGFSFSKNPSFVDHVDITVRFENRIDLGLAPSKVTVEGRGGFLFIRKHFRGNALFEDAKSAT